MIAEDGFHLHVLGAITERRARWWYGNRAFLLNKKRELQTFRLPIAITQKDKKKAKNKIGIILTNLKPV